MFTVGNVNENKVLSLRIEGRLTIEEYRQAIPLVETLLSEHEELRFYCELLNFSGSDPLAIWEGLKFDIRHRRQYGRSAIVGDQQWELWAINFASLFFGQPVKFFFTKDAEEAWSWVNQP